MHKSIIAKIITIIFIIILISGTIGTFFIPYLYNFFKEAGVPLFQEQHLAYKIAFISCYIICLIIVFYLNKVFTNIYHETPFVKKVETSLKIVAILFMILSLIVLIKAVFIPTLLSFVVAAVCFIASLSFYVLAEVIKKAIEYKTEVDYTI